MNTEFKVGQEIYILYMHIHSNKEPEVKVSFIETIGKKYITDYHSRRFYKENLSGELFTEDCPGERGILFSSLEAANDYIERYELITWLAKLNVTDFQNYTLEKLRTVKKILTEGVE